MSFIQAVSDGFAKYATFSGRSRRRAYWYWVLFSALLLASTGFFDRMYGLTFDGATVGGASTAGWLTLGAAVALALPSVAVTFRRLHDTGRSGWWWLLAAFCGIGAIILFIFCLRDSAPGANQYGPNPKTL